MNPDGSLDPTTMAILGFFCLPLILKLIIWVCGKFDNFKIDADNQKREIEAASIKREIADDTAKWIKKTAKEDAECVAKGLPTYRERKREERLAHEDEVARVEGRPTRAERESFSKAMEKIANRGAKGETLAVRCEGCGAPIGDVDKPCDYCGIITVFV